MDINYYISSVYLSLYMFYVIKLLYMIGAVVNVPDYESADLCSNMSPASAAYPALHPSL